MRCCHHHGLSLHPPFEVQLIECQHSHPSDDDGFVVQCGIPPVRLAVVMARLSVVQLSEHHHHCDAITCWNLGASDSDVLGSLSAYPIDD